MRTMNLDHLVNTVRDRHAALKPVDVVDRLDHYELLFPAGEPGRLVPVTPNRSLYNLSERGESQLLQRLGIPAPFFRKLPTNIRWAIANHLSQSGGYDRDVLLRTVDGGRVRACLSAGYAPMDDVDVVPLVADILADRDAKIQIADFHQDHSHLRVLFARTEAEARPGDVVQTGIHISNSEVGMRAVRVEPLVFRLVCTNGLVRPDRSGGGTSIRHYGNSARLKDHLARAIADARDNAQGLLEAFKHSVNHRLNDGAALLESHAQAHDLTREQLRAAIEAFGRAGDPTLFGAVNAVTEIAKAEPTFERRYELERSAASLLGRLDGGR